MTAGQRNEQVANGSALVAQVGQLTEDRIARNARIAELEAALDRARHLARHLFQMIPPEAWRDTGGDDGQGHYEGDYRAEQLAAEIRSWEEAVDA